MKPFLENDKPVVTTDSGFARFGLPPFLLTNLTVAGFEQPTKIQAESIPLLMDGQDLIAQSQTGSGKTAAFAVPILARVQRKSRDIQALVMVPTRELALQVTQVIKTLAGPAVRVTPIYGGAGMTGQIRGLQQGGYQVVVGTPGRLRDMLGQGYLRLDKVQMLVLDEADEMLDLGFARDVEAIISAAPAPSQRQMALFSATLPDWVMDTARKHLRPGYQEVKLEAAANSRPNIEHLMYDMNLSDKHVALRHLLDNEADGSVLVFARTKHGVKKLAARLESEGYSAEGLQGNLSQKAREAVVNAFRNQRIRIMVATNVGARGLDVKGVNHVINFDLPESAELFTHRVGRTARNGASGTAITFLTREDRIKWREIERAMLDGKVPFSRKNWDGPRADPEAREPRVMVAPPTRDRRANFEFEDGRSAASARRPQADRPAFERPRRDSDERFDRPAKRRNDEWQDRPAAGEFQPARFDRNSRPERRDDRSDRPEPGNDRFAPDAPRGNRFDRRPKPFGRDDNRFDRSEPRRGGRFDREERPAARFDRQESSSDRPEPRFAKTGYEGDSQRLDRPAPRRARPAGPRTNRRVNAGR